jgi:NADH dehydrogenase [ubiquinone] 1 alpha subcomplex assembly factor 1
MNLGIPSEKYIFRFDDRNALAGWIVSTDRSIGGASLQLYQCTSVCITLSTGLSECEWAFEQDAIEKHSATTTNPTEDRDVRQEASASAPAAVFRGRLSLACQPTEVGIVRSGYCAVRSSMPVGLLLHGYEGISMRVMTDGREYVLHYVIVVVDTTLIGCYG